MEQLKRIALAAAAGTAVVLMAAPSHAQDFYRSGQVSVALERAFGIHHVSSEVELPGSDVDFSATTIGLGIAGALTPLHWTRAAVDGFISDRLSLGGSLGFFSQSGDADLNGFLFAPRVGYAIPLSRVFTFWPRGGLTYYDVGDRSLLALAGEAMFVISPRPGWGILLGLTLDLGFTGETGNNLDYTEISVGLPAVGLLATF